MKVLFDTNVVSYWMGGEKRFKPGIKGLVNKLKRQKATFYVSAVTFQELLVFAKLKRDDHDTLSFLRPHFVAPLPLDERAAIFAADIGAAVPLAAGAKQAARDVWHRDLAILGSAAAHGIEMLVTANEKNFAPYHERVALEIKVVRPI